MIYLRLAGGLGNQLFQLAAASRLASVDPQIQIAPLTAALGGYSQPRIPDALKLLTSNGLVRELQGWQAQAMQALAIRLRAGRWLPVLGFNDRNFDPVAPQRMSAAACIMDGYFQHGWTEDLLRAAMAAFTFSYPMQNPLDAASSNECVIHIRGGDLLRSAPHAVLDESYYRRAVELARAAGWSHFAVVTDDVSHATEVIDDIRKTLAIQSIRLIEPTSDSLSHFAILCAARARVIGNSTFGWWAGFFGSRQSMTWSPTRMLRARPRDFLLRYEVTVPARMDSDLSDSPAAADAASA
jgi:hypothetical protein